MPLYETMSVLGMPVMTKKSFVATEKALGRSWRESLEESMRRLQGRKRGIPSRGGHSIRECQQLLSSLMGGGANVRINIHRTLNLVQL